MLRPWEGVFNRIRRTYNETSSDRTRSRMASYMNDEPCPDCSGKKLNDAVSRVIVGGVSLPSISSCSVLEALAVVQFWKAGKLDETWDKLGRDKPSSEIISMPKLLSERSIFFGTEII